MAVLALSSLRSSALRGVISPGAFRLLLAVVVVFSHISRYDVGRIAVLLFFFLSGFWVTKVWVEKFGPRNTLHFYAARYLRIAPLYLLVMVVAALLRGMPLGLENFTLLGLASSNNDPTGVSWSLDIELQFYLLLPLLIPLVARSAGWLIVGSLPLAAIAWFVSERYSVSTVFQYLPAFLLGALTYTRAWKPREKAAWISLTAFALGSVAVFFTSFMDKRAPDPFDRDIFSFFWMLPLLPYVAFSLNQRSSRLDRHLGNLSFPLYLVHYPIIALVAGQVGKSSRVGLAAAALACLVALALYLVVDRPVDRWRVRVTENVVAP